MDEETELNGIQFIQYLGIEITRATNGHAEGRLELREELSLDGNRLLAHGGVPFALADSVGVAAAASRLGSTTPTVDLRIDYLRLITET